MLVFDAGDVSGQMVQFEYLKTTQYGRPVAQDAKTFVILSRDGQAYEFPMSRVKKPRNLDSRFTPLSRTSMRASLLREHGHRYEVTGTANYLVVHPQGSGKLWPPRFEQIYRSVYRYVSTRGFDPHEPEFPLVAVVMGSRAEFEAYSRKLNVNVPKNLVGFYHPLSNRIVLYDQTSPGDQAGYTWEHNATTVIHETAHQVAHNIGMHSRFGDTPSWAVEGFGTLFEAPGVWDSKHQTSQESRVNRYYLAQFQSNFADSGKSNWLPELIASDSLFQADATAAYSAAWATTFYLSENMSAEYFAYLKKQFQLPGLRSYPAESRVADFERYFGSDWRMLESRIMRFMQTL